MCAPIVSALKLYATILFLPHKSWFPLYLLFCSPAPQTFSYFQCVELQVLPIFICVKEA